MSESYKTDLKELAKWKLQIDALTELYKTKADALKAKLRELKLDKAIDPDGLSVELTCSKRREFFPSGVRQALGKQADLVIEEAVNLAKFDSIVRNKGEYIITEEQQAQCFSIQTTYALNWGDSLKLYKQRLIIGDKKDGKSK